MPAVFMAMTAAAMLTAPWVLVTDILLRPTKTTGNMPPVPGIAVTRGPGVPGIPVTFTAIVAAGAVAGN